MPVITSGLTGLRRLVWDRNESLTDGCLAVFSEAAMPRLMWLSVSHTRVTKQGVQQLLVVRPQLQVEH